MILLPIGPIGGADFLTRVCGWILVDVYQNLEMSRE